MNEHSPEWLYEQIMKLRVRVDNVEQIQGFLAQRVENLHDKVNLLLKK